MILMEIQYPTSGIRARVMDLRSRLLDGRSDVESTWRLAKASKPNTTIRRREKNSQVQLPTCSTASFGNVHQKKWLRTELDSEAQIDDCG